MSKFFDDEIISLVREIDPKYIFKLAQITASPQADISGICRICGCTDQDCRICIERTGTPCYWLDQQQTICSACENRIEEIQKQMGKFGKVEKCDIANGEFHLLITDGFSVNALNTLSFFKLAASLTRYKMIKKCRTDENFCELILR